jgi:hypothetical protein
MSNPNKIYKITTYRLHSITKKTRIYSGDMVGFYFDLNEAIKAVEENRNDFNDNWYHYCVITEQPEGILYSPEFETQIQWFKFTGPDGATYDRCKWKKIKNQPKCIED